MSNNIPEIRFKGFTHAWEQRTLREVAEFSKGSGYSKGDLTDSGTPIILYGRLYTNYETVIENVNTYATLKDKSVLSQGGEVIVPSSGETAEDISRASVVAKSGTILGGDLNIIKTDSTISPSFLALTISNGSQQKELSKRAQGKSVVHIGNSDLKKVVLNHPSVQEQTAISNFFRTIDDAITLHKRKLDKLKVLKKAYLQKMFPQAGELVPKVRFAGFTEPWEVRKLGEVVSVNPRSCLPDSFEYVDLESVVETSLVTHRTEYKDTAPSRAQRVAKSGDVFFQMVRPYQRNNYLFDLPFEKYVFSTGYAQLRPKMDSYFLLCKLQEENFVAEVLNHCTGTSYPAINSTDLAEIYINITIEESEQTVIGNFFRTLDNQITVQKQKLDQLKQLKAAYLQKMFI